MTSRGVLYLAAPLGTEDPFSAAGRAIRLAERLRIAGYSVICPHLHVLWAIVCPGVNYEEWVRMDLDLVERADAVVRGPGYSPGAEREVAHALVMGIPVLELATWDVTDGQLRLLDETKLRLPGEGGRR